MINTVLFVDNDADFLETRAEYLENANYRVLKAYSLEQAQQLLDKSNIHLIIQDIRMLDDDDERDTSGMTFAKDPLYKTVPKIILTGFPSIDKVREALRVQTDGLPLAWDFLGKNEGPEAMLQALEKAFILHVRINWELTIHWRDRDPISFPHILSLIEPGLKNTHLSDRTSETEELFRKLFYDYNQITLSRLLWCKNNLLAIEAFAYSQIKDEQFVITCGHTQDTLLDRERYKNTAPKDYKATSTSVALSAETLHFAATAWTIPGVNIEETNTLAAFYHKNTSTQVRSTLEYLFRITLDPWHQRSRFIDKNQTLPEIYQKQLEITVDALPQAAFEQKILALCNAACAANLANITLEKEQLVIQFPNGEIVSSLNPVYYIFGDTPFPPTNAVCGAMPGNVDMHNILVETSDGSAWLTDFSQAGMYPIWQDAVSLETSLRFETMDISNLFHVHEFEEQLLNINYLSDRIPTHKVRSEYKKTLHAIQTIRHQTAKIAGEDPLPYYIGLLFFTLGNLQKYTPGVRQGERELTSLLHRLLLAGMLCVKIGQLKDVTPSQTTRNIRIDEGNHQVWIGEQEVNLTPTEFDLLLFLYHHIGQLCTRSDILQGVFGYADAGPDTEKSLINTQIGRLRQKLEVDTSNPKYIITVRGKGYKLISYSE